MVNNYENMVILNPELDDETVQRIVDRVKNIVEGKNGKMDAIEKHGRKRLAYKVGKFNEGLFLQFVYTADPLCIKDIEKSYRLDDSVLKFSILRTK